MQLFPGGAIELHESFNELQRRCASPQNAARIMQEFDNVDVTALAPRVKCPTLVLHCRNDARIPFEEGRFVASMIPGARFVPLESKNHIPLETEPAFQHFLTEMCNFLDAAPELPKQRDSANFDDLTSREREFDRDACVEKACILIEAAAEKGTVLAAFGEAWLPGYPFFAFNAPSPDFRRAASDYLVNAIEIPSSTTDKLCQAAKRATLDVVISVVERDQTTQGTLYCTLLFIGREGLILGRHRKLKPTNAERAIWGMATHQVCIRINVHTLESAA